jgi:glycosyltransferase involved in cell wall biosynthesis
VRIAYLSGSLIPSRYANAVHVMRMCNAFSALGHDVELGCISGATDQKKDILAYYGVDQGFAIRSYPSNAFWARSRLGGLRMARGARSFRPDLVFGRSIPACYFAAQAGLPVILETHNPPHAEPLPERFMLRRLMRMKSVRGLVLISQALRALFEQEADRGTVPLLVAHDAADPLPEAKAHPLGAADRLQAVYVGQLYEGRGIELIEEMARRAPWADFHVIGGMDAAIEAWRRRTADLGNFHLHGFVPPSQTHRYLRSADVLLAPYQSRVSVDDRGDTSRWMSPLKVFEYMAAGRAIVISDIPVLREVLQHGKTALMVPPDDVEGWIGAIRQLHGMPEGRRRLGGAALERFLDAHTWKARAGRILEHFAARDDTKGME